MTVHSLLLDGFAEAAAVRPTEFVEYLEEDSRRLMVGPGIARCSTTANALTRAGTALDAEHLRRLAALIRHWKPSGERQAGIVAATRRHQLDLDRRLRLELLQCLDIARVDAGIVAYVEQEQRALSPPPRRKSKRAHPDPTELHAIESAMRADDMQRASDDDIMNFFAELPDETEWRHPRQFLVGGSIEASREFAKMTKLDVTRGLRLSARFPPKTHERPVGMAIDAAVEVGASADHILSVVESCASRGFDSADFRWHVAWALEKLGLREGQRGLPAQACAMLRSWLTDGSDERVADEPQSGRSERIERILYGSAGFGLLPRGNYPTLHALFVGLARRDPPAWSEWLDVLESHVGRGESTTVWRALVAHDVLFLLNADRQRVESFLSSLLHEVPSLLRTSEGIHLVDRFHRRVDISRSQVWCEAVGNTDDAFLRQAYGELLVLRHVRLPSDGWAESEITRALAEDAPLDGRTTAERRGIALMSAHVWNGGHGGSGPAKWLTRLVADPDPGVSQAVVDVFGYGTAPPFDASIAEILRAIADHPVHLTRGSLEGLLQAVEKYTADAPVVAARLATAVVDASEGDLGDVRQRAMRYATHLVDIAVTLQDLPGHLDRGLVLFERLQDLHLNEVDEVLGEGQPWFVGRPSSRPRHRSRPTKS